MTENKGRRLGLLALVIVAIVVVGLFLWFGGPGSGPEQVAEAAPITVGGIAPLTGEGAAYGTWAQRGVELALEDVNPSDDAPLYRVIWEDSKLDPTAAISAYLKLVDFNNVPIVIGPLTSGETRACLPKANEKEVPILSPTATSDEFRDAGQWFFRVCPTNLLQADTAAEFAVENLGAETAFILFEEIAYGSDLAAAFGPSFEALGGEILGRDSFPEGETDYRPYIQKIKQLDPDVVYAPSNYTEAGTLLRQLDQLEVDVPIIGGDGSYGEALLDIAGPAAEGTYWTTIAWGTGESEAVAESFETRYESRYGEPPHQFAGLYYDAARVVFEVIDRQDMTGQQVREALLAMEPFHGATGTSEFTEKGQVSKSFAVYQVQNDEYRQVSP